MPDTPIDLSEGIQSVRLKVPTAVVPVPPEGFAQLHSPAVGELALRLPDGSVVAIGGGGGGGGDTIAGTGGIATTLAGSFWGGAGISLKPSAGYAILLDGPVVGSDFRPFGVQVDTVAISSAELLALHTTGITLVPAQGSGRVVMPLAIISRFVFGGVAYTTGGGNFLEVGWPDGVAGIAAISIPINRVAISADALFVDLMTTAGVGDPADFANQPLGVRLDGPLADGNGSATVTTLWVPV